MKVRNKKGKKIIKPAGSELMDYLNRGYAIFIFGDIYAIPL